MAEQIVKGWRDVARKRGGVWIRDERCAHRRGQVNDEWDPDDFGVDGVGVTEAAILAERVSVIGREDHDARIVEVSLFESVNEPAETGVDPVQP